MFQSTRPRGARRPPLRDCGGCGRFNPRARGGRDGSPAGQCRILWRFNPRARGGRDQITAVEFFQAMVSIHAPAGGATIQPRALDKSRSFNPRARGGRDVSCLFSWDKPRSVSIHAPAGGATELRYIVSMLSVVSIHAPAGGATSMGPDGDKHYVVSIHAPAGGATTMSGF